MLKGFGSSEELLIFAAAFRKRSLEVLGSEGRIVDGSGRSGEKIHNGLWGSIADRNFALPLAETSAAAGYYEHVHDRKRAWPEPIQFFDLLSILRTAGVLVI